MAESDGLLNRYTFNRVSGVRIPLSPPVFPSSTYLLLGCFLHPLVTTNPLASIGIKGDWLDHCGRGITWRTSAFPSLQILARKRPPQALCQDTEIKCTPVAVGGAAKGYSVNTVQTSGHSALRLSSVSEFKLATIRELTIENPLLESPEKVRDFFLSFIENSGVYRAEVENVIVLFLNTRRRVKGFQVVSKGTLDTLLVHPREVFRGARIRGLSPP